jgi:hypothetical protein
MMGDILLGRFSCAFANSTTTTGREWAYSDAF